MPTEPNRSPSTILLTRLLIILVIFGIGWNYWLPTAEDYFNLQTREGYPPNIDFFAYYNAGNRFEEGANPYYWAETNPAEGNFSDFIYPPAILPLLKTLSSLPYNNARSLWAGLYGTLLLLALITMQQLLPEKNRWLYILFSSFLFLTSFPLLLHIRNGQHDSAESGFIPETKSPACRNSACRCSSGQG